jgi:peptidoglycan/LPS O-acetylase OafA/YrhL
MLQRIQTVYLAIALLATAVLPFVFPLYVDGTGANYYFAKNLAYVFLFGLSTVLTIMSIMTYKKRKRQFAMGRLNIILNLILLGLFVYQSLNLSGEADREKYVSEKGIGMILPVISIVFLVLANRAIKKDEDLVKSVDRLR